MQMAPLTTVAVVHTMHVQTLNADVASMLSPHALAATWGICGHSLYRAPIP